MFANAPTWTNERVELLKSHFEAGLSCRQIAATIGVSRNAVIGKLSRLNLTRGKNGHQRRSSRDKSAKEKRPKPTPRMQYRILQAWYADPDPAIEDQPIHNGHTCSLLELTAAKCRWPINTPGAEDFCFCGNAPVEGLPYCAGHTRMAYRAPYRQRVTRG